MNCIRSLLLFVLFTINGFIASAQDTVINSYAAIVSQSPCTNSFVVDASTGFSSGDTVLMIQMKGALIDTTNSASFGNVLDYRGAGNYEYNVVKSVTGTTIELKYKLRRSFQIPNGKVQLVRIPSYTNYSTNKTHTAMQWNGSKGGVFAINVANTLTLNNPIDVTGKGFTGATSQVLHSNNAYCNSTDYFYPSNVDYAAMKGEGFTIVNADKTYGKGKLGNGGGGGNAHNSGGGGGSNAGSGGLGGNQWGGCSPITGAGGNGGAGTILSNANNKVFLGGGGGAGHTNDYTNAIGGNGGGLVFINAGTLNTQSGGIIKANGAQGPNCTSLGSIGYSCADGMGGGGAGGGVLLNATNFTNNISIEAKGGKGADVIYIPTVAAEVFGPGGGGGGGFVWLAQATMPANVLMTTAAGTYGITTYNGGANGAVGGTSGQSLVGLTVGFPSSTDTFFKTRAAFLDSAAATMCFGRKLIDVSTTTTTGIVSRTWILPTTTITTVANLTYNFGSPGTYLVKLVVTDANGCRDTSARNVIVPPQQRFANAGPDVTVCRPGRPVTLLATGGSSYLWDANPTLSSTNVASPIATPGLTTSYYVTVTNAIGCTDRDTVVVTVGVGIPGPGVSIAVSPGLFVMPGQLVTFTASVTNGGPSPTYQWKKNGNIISGATLSIYQTNGIIDGDNISVVVRSTDTCAVPDSALSNVIRMNVESNAVRNVQGALGNLTLFPSPVSNMLNISGNTDSNEPVQYQVHNAIGQIISHGRLQPVNRHIDAVVVLPLSIASGTYSITTVQSNQRASKLFTVMQH